jgi:hypothetical protein
MEELSSPSLFESSEEKRSDKLAKEFSRWCSSFGVEFRNSPDVINLRTWTQKINLKLKESEENEVLAEARKLYLKRIDQLMKKPELIAAG